MAYARMGTGKSDIYFYCSDVDTPRFECPSCCLDSSEDHYAWLRGVKEAIAHIEEHIAAGHKVPDSVIPHILLDFPMEMPVWASQIFGYSTIDSCLTHAMRRINEAIALLSSLEPQHSDQKHQIFSLLTRAKLVLWNAKNRVKGPG